MVYLSLLPIIGGVGIASLEELSFTWLAFASAMCSNVFSASRGLVGKGLMGRFPAQNLYALMTLIAAVVITPISLCVESPRMIITAVKASLAAGTNARTLAAHTALSGVFYYLYNELAFLALESVTPITHAVGNTVKRVVIILASVAVFNNPLTPKGKVGSVVAIAGTLLYSLAKQRWK